MNPRSIITISLLVLAVGGIIYVLAGGEEPATQGEPTGPDDPARAGPTVAGEREAAVGRESQDDLPSDGVVVYYFHGRQRCYTCNKMEELARQTVSEEFADDLRDGEVVFKTVNMQAPEGSHFVEDFQLRSAGVVMVERQHGRDLRWRRLDEVWMKIRNEDEYKGYIAENLTECLHGVGQERG